MCIRDRRRVRKSMLECPLNMIQWSIWHNPYRIIGALSDGTISLWNLQPYDSEMASMFRTGPPMIRFQAHEKNCHSVAWSAEDQNLFLSVGEDHSFKLWDWRKPWHTIYSITFGGGLAISLDWGLCSSDHTFPYAAVAMEDDRLKFFDIRGLVTSYTHQGFEDPDGGMMWSTSIAYHIPAVAVCGTSGKLTLCDMTKLKVSRHGNFENFPAWTFSRITKQDDIYVFTKSSINQTDSTPQEQIQPQAQDLSSQLVSEVLENMDASASLIQGLSMDGLTSLANSTMEDLPIIPEMPQIATIPITPEKTKKKNQSKKKAAAVPMEEGFPQTFKSFPDILVSIHRVKFNSNVGYREWLASGGALGIVQIQKYPGEVE
eukprot:TRINITY_DN3477_c0_g1_i2.p1 TRINITY_DN3477_c0_g1~~TRINITY_DN3477_c0_g1_i2.p1  ORF type:complete len:373 (+),score=87.46 TRINITY_DN3477_c0_g1_i2:53-1171(+)